MINEAKKRLDSKVNLTIGDSENLPYENNQFDVIICNASFHHYPKSNLVLKEIKRVLKSDGIFILGDPTIPFSLFLKVFNYFLKYSNSGDYKIYSKKEIIELLNKNGFSVENFKMINHRSFALNAINTNNDTLLIKFDILLKSTKKLLNKYSLSSFYKIIYIKIFTHNNTILTKSGFYDLLFRFWLIYLLALVIFTILYSSSYYLLVLFYPYFQ